MLLSISNFLLLLDAPWHITFMASSIEMLGGSGKYLETEFYKIVDRYVNVSFSPIKHRTAHITVDCSMN
jgi:hypothetical protein